MEKKLDEFGTSFSPPIMKPKTETSLILTRTTIITLTVTFDPVTAVSSKFFSILHVSSWDDTELTCGKERIQTTF